MACQSSPRVNDSVTETCPAAETAPYLLPVVRTGPLQEPADLGLLRLGDALQEGGVLLHPEQQLLLRLHHHGYTGGIVSQ